VQPNHRGGVVLIEQKKKNKDFTNEKLDRDQSLPFSSFFAFLEVVASERPTGNVKNK